MITLFDQLFVFFFVAFVVLILAYTAAFRPTIAVGFLFVLITLFWRTISTAYIDITGPVYSSQLLRSVGPGLATVTQSIAYLLTLVPFFYFFDPKKVNDWNRAPFERQTRWMTLPTIIFLISSLFLLALYLDLIRRGIIPLFAKMERYVYTSEYAGPLHRFLARYGDLIAVLWGIMFAAVRLRENRVDLRFIGILVVTFAYMLLTGNRFSPFYSFGCHFLAPFAAVVAIKNINRCWNWPFAWVTQIFRPRELLAIGVLLVVALSASAIGIYNSLVNVRDTSDVSPETRFEERVLIQPSEIGWVSYRRIFLEGEWRPEAAANRLFLNPIDARRNTSIQYLMSETIGEPRTELHLSGGFQFAGGFPEIFFELFGPYLAWPFLLAAGWIAAALLATFIRAIVEGHYLTAFWCSYVLYGFEVMYIGGMLNFVLPWTFWVKLACLVMSIVIERSLNAFGVDLVPWRMIRLPEFVASRRA